ncbi:MAG: peptidoglycan editing factor PgeF [Burkholderiales bacterium]
MDPWIIPEWPAPPNVRSLITTRKGGESIGRFASKGDGDPDYARNLDLLRRHLPGEPTWLRQVHGARVVEADSTEGPPEADAVFTRAENVVCAVLSADCLPVLFCDEQGTIVAAAHAGWRGLAAGILERTVEALETAPRNLIAYFGPAIGPRAFEVGDEVRRAFTRIQAEAAKAFTAQQGDKWLADLYLLARLRLKTVGVTRVLGGGLCTYTDSERFFSHRRDGITGRMASLIWLDSGPRQDPRPSSHFRFPPPV